MPDPRAWFAIMVLLCVVLPVTCWVDMIAWRKAYPTAIGRLLHDIAKLLLVLAVLSVVIVGCMAGILTELQLRLAAAFGPILGITGGVLHLLARTRPADSQDDSGDGCRDRAAQDQTKNDDPARDKPTDAKGD